MKTLNKVLFTLFLIFCSATANAHPNGLYVLEYPVNMPDISITDENGDPFQILDSSAELTIMTFWSKTCFPCIKEMKHLERFAKKAQADNILTILVSSAGEWSNNLQQRQFLTKYGAPTIPFYNDKENALSLSLGIGSTPYTVIMNKNGKKVATIQGEINWSSDKLYHKILRLIP